MTTFPKYGELSGQSLDAMQPAHRLDGVDPNKRHHQDFVLWIAAGPRRELVFDSPWGPGYPGWHIECSAMSLHHLGEHFELHTGGIDNLFPHHEDEIAQSEGAVGHRVVDLWVHGEHLLMGSAKMAKSAGNVVTIQTLIDRGYDPLAFRYLCFNGRYRRQVDFTDDAIDSAATTLRRLRERVAMLGPVATKIESSGAESHHQRFMSAIDNDLDLPAAVTVLHEALSDEVVAPSERAALITSWDEILGLDLASSSSLPEDLVALIEQREEARRTKDFARADSIRDQLKQAGVELLDGQEKTTWVRR